MSIRGLILCSMMAGCSLLSTPEVVPLPDAGQVVPDAGVRRWTRASPACAQTRSNAVRGG